jgi:hypothetical protein
MQVHEITLTEANPARVPVKTGIAQRAQTRNAPPPQPRAATTQQAQQPSAPADPWTEKLRAAQKDYGDVPAWQQALALKTAKMLRPGGPLPAKAAPQQPQVTQAQWDTTMRQTQSQFPGLTPQQYQAAVQKRLGVTAPTTTAQQPAPAPTTPAPQPAAPAKPAAAQLAPAQAPAQPAPAQTYPPITVGSGPKATVYVNKGQGYVDSKTGKPIPPAILKALGPQ